MYFTVKKPVKSGKKDILLEGLRRFGLVRKADVSNPSSFYYGINVSRFCEPLDQLDVLLLLSKLRRSGLDVGLTLFVAGRYSQLNGRCVAEVLTEKEEQKLRLFSAAARIIDPMLSLTLLKTNDLWYAPQYWDEVDRLKETEGIISCERKGDKFCMLAGLLEPELQAIIPPGVVDTLGSVDGPALYRLFEVAEAAFLKKTMSVDAKIGPESEAEYDRFIGGFMDIVQLEQPLDFRSRNGIMKPITPYIGKKGEQRIFIQDDKAGLVIKIMKLAQRASGQQVFIEDNMNPFVRIAVLSAESAASASSGPLLLGSRRVYEGEDVVDFFLKAGTQSLLRYSSVVAECLWAYMLSPIQRLIVNGERDI